MSAGTFTRDGSRIVIRPGPGAWTREFAWSESGYPMTTDVPGDGLTVRYTIHVAGLAPEDGIAMYRVTLEAHAAGAEHNGPHAVIVLSDVTMTAWRFDEPGDVRESAEGSIRQAHHWVALALRLADSTGDAWLRHMVPA